MCLYIMYRSARMHVGMFFFGGVCIHICALCVCVCVQGYICVFACVCVCLCVSLHVLGVVSE